MHVSGALGKPTVGIYGSTRADRTGPLGTRTKILYKQIECSPCLKRTCKFGHRAADNVGRHGPQPQAALGQQMLLGVEGLDQHLLRRRGACFARRLDRRHRPEHAAPIGPGVVARQRRLAGQIDAALRVGLKGRLGLVRPQSEIVALHAAAAQAHRRTGGSPSTVSASASPPSTSGPGLAWMVCALAVTAAAERARASAQAAKSWVCRRCCIVKAP